MLEDFRDCSIVLKQCGKLIIFHRLAHPGLHLPHLLTQLEQITGCGHNLLKHRAPAHLPDILGEVSDDCFFGAGDITFIGLCFSRYEAENGCFSGAVGPHQTGACARENLQAGISEQNLGTDLLVYIRQVYHGVFR